jgi:hypothetical protein
MFREDIFICLLSAYLRSNQMAFLKLYFKKPPLTHAWLNHICVNNYHFCTIIQNSRYFSSSKMNKENLDHQLLLVSIWGLTSYGWLIGHPKEKRSGLPFLLNRYEVYSPSYRVKWPFLLVRRNDHLFLYVYPWLDVKEMHHKRRFLTFVIQPWRS